MPERCDVLLLGAGLMAKPALKALEAEGFSVTVASRTLNQAQQLCRGMRAATPLKLDVTEHENLDAALAQSRLVLNLVPYIHNVAIIRSAIRTRTNVVTTSYISPAIQELEPEIEAAGITVFNEAGLDPGVDHLYAVKVVQEVHAAGGKILSFISNCGGLPAPENSGNPFGLKFSWSPRGVLLASQSPARQLLDGKIVETKGGADLFARARPYPIYPGFSFVEFPNRDSAAYALRYDIPEARTVSRGNLRYAGCIELFQALSAMGYFSSAPLAILSRSTEAARLHWYSLTAVLLGLEADVNKTELYDRIISRVPETVASTPRSHILHGLKWLGLFSRTKIVESHDNPLDTICALMQERMKLQDGERDMVILQHRFEIHHANGHREIRTSTLLRYGDPVGQPDGNSAMATLVGQASAVAASLVLDKTISQPGLLAPLTSSIATPFRRRLKERYGIECREDTHDIEAEFANQF